MPRVRRPLLALIGLVAALVVGYTVHALRSHDSTGPTRPAAPSVSRSSSMRDSRPGVSHTGPRALRAADR